MSYEVEALKKDLEVNVVVKVGTDYFAYKLPDSGLSIPESHLCLDEPNVNGFSVDIRQISTPIGTFSFQLQENNDEPVISSIIMADPAQWLNKEVIAYAGFITGDYDFSDYKEIARTIIHGVTKLRNGYSITSREATSLLEVQAFNLNDTLAVSILAGSTTLDIFDASTWPSTGLMEVGGEFIAYTTKTGNTLGGLVRAQLGSTAAAHEVGTPVYFVTVVEDVNPIDFLLQAILSGDGDGSNEATYDVLPFGPKIASSLVDIASFEQIRDEFFTDELHTYYIYNNDSLLRFLEQSALVATNTRLIIDGGVISLTLLDQADFEAEFPIIDESTIVGTPTWSLGMDKIINVVEVFYDYNQASRRYESKQTFRDLDSIALYGEKRALKLELLGVTSGNDGSAIANERAQRLLGRLSTARGRVEFTAQLDASIYPVGTNVQIIHRYLPQQGGTLGFSDRLEIMSRDLDLKNARVRLRLEFTSYTGIRIAFIAPSPRIASITDQRTFTLDDASLLRVGYVMKLFKDGPLDGDGNPTPGSYLPDGPNVIESIVGNTVTMRDAFSSTLQADLWLKFADYDSASEEQKARYAFIGPNTGLFTDGSKTYQVIF